MEWSNKTPTTGGLYWFYGELYRPLSQRPEPKLELVEVSKISNGYMYVANGQFVSEQEGMQGLWQKANLPELPQGWKYHWQDRYFWCVNPKCEEFHKHWEIEWSLRFDAEKNGNQDYHCKQCYSNLELVTDDLSIFPDHEIDHRKK